MREKCECHPRDLLEIEMQVTWFSDTSCYVFCREHNVFVHFTVPKGTRERISAGSINGHPYASQFDRGAES